MGERQVAARVLVSTAVLWVSATAHVTGDDSWDEDEPASLIDTTWTEVFVDPPPSTCWTTWESDSTCNPLSTAIKSAVDNTIIHVRAGEYRNKGWEDTMPRTTNLHNSWLVEIKNKNRLTIQAAAGASTKPLLRFDGTGGFSIKDSHHVTIKGLEIEGPSNRITGKEASTERARLTSRSLDGKMTGTCSTNECASCDTSSSCAATVNCKWNSKGFCQGSTLGYFNGRGIAIWAGTTGSTNVKISENLVHHCPASGIRANKGDEIYIENNVVYDNIWWSTSGESAIVLAESVGTGTCSLANNVVFGNRNFMPFYTASLTDLPGQTGSSIGHYASWNQDYIIDGSGVYISRNQDYQGTFQIEGNTCYDNGINGVVVHNTNNDKVSVSVKNNIVFSNGKTTKDVESRQNAGGLAVNSGNNIDLEGNHVSTSVDGDFSYQCFGTCNILKGSDNTACLPTKVAKIYEDFVTETSTCNIDEDGIRANYPTSSMPNAPQYTKWCSNCGNKVSKYMETKGLTCGKTLTGVWGNKNAKRLCRNSETWAKMKYCQQTCFEQNMGYDGDLCC